MSKRVSPLQPILRQWSWLLGILATGIVVTMWNGWFWRQDLLLYDAALARGPAPDGIVIVAIDDASLRQLGQWPWRRAIHAALLDRLRAAGTRGVALDVIFNEPDTNAPGDDAALATAMRAGPPTALPFIVDWQREDHRPRELTPIAPLMTAAAALGHVHLEIDRDGIARSVFLREGADTPNRSHLALALLEALGEATSNDLPGTRPALVHNTDGAWARDYQMLIPYLGPPGHFQRVSYVDVLRGSVPDATLRGKLVLIGATAQGLSDAYPTPHSGESVAMPGVEIAANVLHALQTQRVIHQVPRVWAIAIALVPLLVGFIGLLRFSPRHSLALIALLCLITLGLSFAALRLGHWWWSPASALAALILAYPLWSWRRLEATQIYLDEELARLDREPVLLPFAPSRHPPLQQLSDVLQRRIDRVRDATERLRSLRKLLSDTFTALPDATLLVDLGDRVVIANPSAIALFGVTHASALEDQLFAPLIDDLLRESKATYRSLVDHAPTAIELRHPNGRNLMMRVAAFYDSVGTRAGTVWDIADVTTLKEAERERDDTIRFLSHDLRSPSSSLLGLASTLRDPERAPSPTETAHRIESLAGRTLALADGFIALARASIIEPDRFESIDLRDPIQDAIDEVWSIAEAKRVILKSQSTQDAALVSGDRQMLARAFANLLNNAVKFSPANAVVDIAIALDNKRWVVSVRDRGPGIPRDRQPELFQRFRRAMHHGDADPGGVGLGLAFVRTVAVRHRGAVAVESDIGAGAIFRLILPMLDATTELLPQADR